MKKRLNLNLTAMMACLSLFFAGCSEQRSVAPPQTSSPNESSSGEQSSGESATNSEESLSNEAEGGL